MTAFALFGSRVSQTVVLAVRKRPLLALSAALALVFAAVVASDTVGRGMSLRRALQPPLQAPSVDDPAAARIVPERKLWGVGLHMGAILHDTPTLRRNLSELGVNSARLDLYWSNFEKTEGTFEWPAKLTNVSDMLAPASAAQIKPFGILDYANPLYFKGLPKSASERDAFVRYVRVVARRHGKQVSAFELWNEWNIGGGTNPREKGTAADYVDLLRAVRTALNEDAKGVPLIAGSIAYRDMSWTREFVKLGGLALCDGFSVHPYNFADRDASAEEIVRWLDGFSQELSGKKGRLPIYVTEIGWPNHTGKGGSTESVTAQRLLKLMLLLATRGYVAGVWWYDLVDDGTDLEDKEFHFGLLRRDGTPKPAFHAYKAFLALFKTAHFKGQQSADGALALEFRDAKGRRLVAAWSAEGDESAYVHVKGRASLLPIEGVDDAQVAAELASSRSIHLRDWPVLLHLDGKARLELARSPASPKE